MRKDKNWEGAEKNENHPFSTKDIIQERAKKREIKFGNKKRLIETKWKITSNDIIAGNGRILIVHEYCLVIFV